MPVTTISTDPRIVAGVDGSVESLAALRWAISQAELTGGHPVVEQGRPAHVLLNAA